MCKKKPLPRCYGHAQADLEKFEKAHPGVAALDDVQLYSAHAQAVAKKDRPKMSVLGQMLDLRLDRDATSTGIKTLEDQLAANPADTVAWYRYQAAKSAIAARKDAAAALDGLDWTDEPNKTLVEERERLARTEARHAASLAVRGKISDKDIVALTNAYEAVLEEEAIARTYAADKHPHPSAKASERMTWQRLRQDAEGEAEALAMATHRSAAIATWTYPHAIPPSGRSQDRRGVQISALDGVRIAALTRTPVRYEFGQVAVDSEENAIRQRLWRAGYHSPQPAGPIIVRQLGRAA